MKRIHLTLPVILLAIVAASAGVSAVAAHTPKHRDWSRDHALMAGDLKSLLHYNPTDGASHEGDVRRGMDPANVYP